MKILKLIAATTLALSVSSLLAQDQYIKAKVSQNDVTEHNKMVDPKSVPASNATDSIDDWSDEVLEQFGIDSYGENDGKFILFASQTVSLKPNDPQFGDALINAYDKAILSLQEEYIMTRFGKTTVEKIRSFYSNRSTDAKDIELPKQSKDLLSKVINLFEKKLDVVEKELDQELIALGVDEESLKNMPETIKKDTFKDKFVKNTLRKASGSIAGLVPIQTKLIIDKRGRAVIGVVGIASNKTIQIAKDISKQRASNITGKGREVKSLLPRGNDAFLGTIGTRLAYDLDGSPMIISYGLGSYVEDAGDDYMNAELKAEAKLSAVANADAQIAELINGRMNAKSERKRGEEIRKYVEREVRPESDTVEKSVKNMIKITNRYSKSAASAKLQGISTIKKWRYTIPNSKIKMVGAVRVWKYSTLNAVKGFNKPKKTNSSNYTEKKKSYQSDSYESASRSVNTMDDF